MIANQGVRIHYKPDANGEVTIKIYDFEMKLVKTILENTPRAGGVEYDQVWDGKNEKDEIVANGIYFFKIEGPDGQKEWGKIGVIR
jgi:flagellar hook assembly protein FlgD